MKLTTGYQALLDAAEAEIETISPVQANELTDEENVQFVDIRDIRELQREGKVPGALHATRGMLEFWIDPESPYYKDIFGSGKRFVFYCQSGWRSALATQTVQQMGLPRVCHIGGGFKAWVDAGYPVEALPERR
jgi:rhodanese-related sulfurtransferase